MKPPASGVNELRAAPYWVRLAAGVARVLPFGRYRFAHMLPRDLEPFRTHLSKSCGGYAFRCDLRDMIAREACYTGQYEPQETMLLRALLGPGMTFVDVGANWGYHSLLAASLVQPKGRIVSLEPDPRVFANLSANIADNDLSSFVTSMQIAAAETSGELLLAGYRETDGNFGISKLATSAATSGAFKVKAEPLDSLLRDLKIERIDLLKMDIEGAEAQALRGLSDSLRQHRVARLLVELHPAELGQMGSSTAEVVQYLQSFDYQGYWIDHSLKMTREAAYSKNLPLSRLLRKLEAVEQVDPWPHTVWLAPGVTLPEHLGMAC